MRILMDVTSLMDRNLTGIGIYIKNLISHLQTIPNVDIDGAWYAEKYKKRDIISSHISLTLKPYFRFISAFNFGKYDIFHGPDYKIPSGSFYKKVVTIHDLVDYESTIIDKKRAEQGIYRFEKMLFKARPDMIITVSDFTRNCLLSRFPQFESITKSIYLGIDHIPSFEPAAIRKKPFPFPYILFVGTIDKRKNLVKVIEGFEIAKETLRELHLVIVGKDGYRHEIADEKINSSRYAEHIHRLGFINNEGLVRLYRHAEVFVSPSLYEGFGIPILEAMKLGCPVVTSNIGAMKEISGNAAVLISPDDAEDIAQKIISICSDSALRAKLIYSGKSRSEHFSWAKFADETAQVYSSLLLVCPFLGSC